MSATQDPSTATQPASAGALPAPRQPRLWPAMGLAASYWIAWVIATYFLTNAFAKFLTIFWAPMLVGLGIIIWYLGFSRMPWRDRLFGLGSLVSGGLLALAVADRSMKMGMLMYALPVAVTAAVAWLVLTHGAFTSRGRIGLALVSLLSWGYFTLVRVDGIDGNLSAERSWRWSPTAEDIFLQQRQSQTLVSREAPVETPSETLVPSQSEWPEFRGPRRDGVARGVSINGDWTQSPPRELWRRRVGPGWSSIVVSDTHGFTQEQRGEAEAVVCFDLTTGQEIWSHEDQARFWEVVAGAGPRATPTLHEGRVYALGGSGRLNCLSAATGEVVWSHDIQVDAGLENPPAWGFSSSPLIAHGIVTVFAGGKDGKSVLAYDAGSGELKWSAGKGTHSYSSPQLVTFAGAPTDEAEQVLMISDHGLEAFHPVTGKVLWEHDWNLEGIFRVCQPQVVNGNQVLVATGMGHGTRLLEVSQEGDAWQVKELWTSRDLKPYFNDFVQHGEFLYGFDGNILVCIDLATGKRQWKKGRYGHGQALLIGDSGLLMIISETGEAVLAEITPKNLVEKGKFQALAGKTWNHPVVAGGKILFRNGEEMSCYELTSAAPTSAAVP